jgi:hypothetical protein
VETIFFGGGTPSLMAGTSVAQVLEKIARLWPMANDLEITLEANPASVDAARFADYRAAGVTRLSRPPATPAANLSLSLEIASSGCAGTKPATCAACFALQLDRWPTSPTRIDVLSFGSTGGEPPICIGVARCRSTFG